MRFQRLHVFDLGLFWFECVNCSETKAQPGILSVCPVFVSACRYFVVFMWVYWNVNISHATTMFLSYILLVCQPSYFLDKLHMPAWLILQTLSICWSCEQAKYIKMNVSTNQETKRLGRIWHSIACGWRFAVISDRSLEYLWFVKEPVFSV